MDLLYLGSGAFGLPTLADLVARHTVRAIVTQPDKPAGRGGSLTPTPIAEWAASFAPSIPILKPARINDPAVVEQVRAFPADAWVVIAFGQKLGKPLLEDRFAVNLHASLLPRWRGAAPINAAMIAGDAETGNSAITLAERMDAGLVLGQTRRPADPAMTAGEMHDALASDGPALIGDVLVQYRAGKMHGMPQDESLVTIAPKLSKADGWVDWSKPASVCRNRIHGLTPWPGVPVRIGGVELKLCRTQVADGDSKPEGVGCLADPAGGVIGCGDGTALRMLGVLPSGKRLMSWSDFARGTRIAPGEAVVPVWSPPGSANG